MALLAKGFAAIAFQLVSGTLFLAYGPATAGVAVGFLLGVPLGLLVCRVARPLTLPAIFLFAAAGLAPGFLVVVVPVGRVVILGPSNEMPVGEDVAGYVAPGWRVRSDLAYEQAVQATARSRSYRRRVVPVVRDGWTPTRPVDAWAVAEFSTSGRPLGWHTTAADEVGGEYVRLTGPSANSIRETVRRAAAERGLTAGDQSPVLLHTETVAGAQQQQFWEIGRAGFVLAGVWSVVVGLVAVLAIWRHLRERRAALVR